jgi:DtxR family manganese transport transcriptional regulator
MSPTNSNRIAARHRRTRKDHSTETAEDYVEAVAEIQELRGNCRVVDLAERFAVSHVTVTKIISRLKKEGFVDTEPYRPVVLTEKGARLAAESQERHQLVYHFLLSIGVPERIAAIDSEGIEHHVSPETLERFRALAEEYRKKGFNIPSGSAKELPQPQSSRKNDKKRRGSSRSKSK